MRTSLQTTFMSDVARLRIVSVWASIRVVSRMSVV
jgi:hypothetical protein